MKYIHLIWDFDGMLFNTYPRMAKAFQKALSEMGVEDDYENIMARIKISVRQAAIDYAKEYNLDRAALSERYHLHEHAMPVETMVPYEGMCELLKDAVEAGCRHYLYTHRDDSALEALERYGIRDLFSGAITWLDHFPAKPAPDALLHLIKKHGLNPAECLMLGDRDIDVQAATNAGIAGALFDPAHFYDGFENELRADSVAALRQLLEI